MQVVSAAISQVQPMRMRMADNYLFELSENCYHDKDVETERSFCGSVAARKASKPTANMSQR